MAAPVCGNRAEIGAVIHARGGADGSAGCCGFPGSV